MIIKYMGFAALGMSFAVQAETLQFDTIKINELARLGYSQILNQDYIADTDFNNDTKTVSMYLKNQSNIQLENSLNNVINAAGYDVIKKNGLITISKKSDFKKLDLTPFVYKPKYRDVSYLTDMVSNLFTDGNFTFQRKVQSAKNTPLATGASDSGTSALSQISKPQDVFIFNGTKNEITQLKQLLTVLDVPENQVQITAYLYEVTKNDTNASSFQLAANILGQVFKVDVAGQLLANSLNFSNANFNLAISALASDSRFNVVSSPLLMVKNRQKGSFSVGADVPILGQVSFNQTGQAVQSVEYKPSGVILDLTPVFNDENIELTIHHQISNFIQTTNGVNNSPTLIKRELDTVVNSKFEDIILLGGLSETKDTKSKSGLPFLPDFLKTKSSEVSKSDILLLLHVKKI